MNHIHSFFKANHKRFCYILSLPQKAIASKIARLDKEKQNLADILQALNEKEVTA